MLVSLMASCPPRRDRADDVLIMRARGHQADEVIRLRSWGSDEMRRRRGDPARQADPRLAEYAFLIKCAEGAEEGTEEHEGILNVGHAHLMREALGETLDSNQRADERGIGGKHSATPSRRLRQVISGISGRPSRGGHLGDIISRSPSSPLPSPGSSALTNTTRRGRQFECPSCSR